MDEKKRKEIHIEVKSEIEDRQRDIAMFNTRGDEVVLSRTDDIINQTIDLTEKAAAEKFKAALEKALPCNIFGEGTQVVHLDNNWCSDMGGTAWCPNCQKRKAILKEVGIE